MNIDIILDLFLIFLFLCGAFALYGSSLLNAVIVFGAFSFFSALIFTLMGALDVAFTEACIGAAITTIYFVTGIFKTSKKDEVKS
ncbi:MAG TPA: DUF4040 domain-containing protein [Oligoflexia bacterium]|nr:DUF4040 domain-containing protein [Oligoflexia bacterium]HMR24727.1 DUF4040 domain-containing protein [Oligoflexia bacterium]